MVISVAADKSRRAGILNASSRPSRPPLPVRAPRCGP